MNKLVIPVLTLLVLSFLISPIIAQDNADTVEVTEEDQEEVDDFEISHGANMRLLQLERAIARNILIGTEVIKVIEKNHPEEDVSDMNVILAEMETLLEEVRGMELEGEARELAEQFLAIKKESINLSREFKALALDILTPEDRAEIGRAIAGIHDEFSELQERIRNARRELNAQRLRNMLWRMGSDNPQLVERIRKGELDKEQIKEQVRSNFREMTQEQRRDAIQNMTAEATRTRTQVRDMIRTVAERIEEAVRERVQERTETRNETRQQLLDRVQNMTSTRARIIEQVKTATAQRIASKYQTPGGANA